jgi:hypothetical protein
VNEPPNLFFRQALARYNLECSFATRPSSQTKQALDRARARVKSQRINSGLFLHSEYDPSTVSFDLWTSPHPLNYATQP